MYYTLKENETMADVLGRITDSFEWVRDVAPVAYWYEELYENGRLRSIHYSGQMRRMLGYGSSAEFPDELETLTSHIHPDDVQLMLDNAIAAGTGKTDRYDVQYRIRRADGEYMWVNATGQVIKNAAGTTVGMYGAFIDISEEIALREEQENRQHNDRLIEGFTKEYEVALLVNLSDGQYRVLRGKPEMDAILPRRGDFIPALERYAEIMVHPADREKFAQMREPLEFVRANVPAGQSSSFEFRSSTSGRTEWYRGTFNRISEETVMFGFRNCDGEHTARLVNEKLIGEYDAIYVVSLLRNRIRAVRSSRVSRAGAFEDERDYTAALLKFAETVAPRYRQDWINFSDPEYMKAYMAEDDRREFVYELPESERTMRRFTADVIERDRGGTAISLLFSFTGIDDTRAEAIRLHRQMAEQKEQLQEALSRSEALYGMIDGYKWSYGISAGGEVVSATYNEGVVSKTDAYNPGDPMAWVALIHPDDRERVFAEFMAAVRDRSGATPYGTVYRMLRKDGKYVWARTSGRVIPHADGTAELLGMSIDITAQMEQQQQRLLGAVPISPDILSKEHIGMWAFELDEGQPPRMYGDEAMLRLVGLDRQVPPEEMYHAWYDHIDAGSYGLVQDTVDRMIAGEHAEVQYPWHCPDGRTMIVRCGGVRNPEYTKGIRVEGTHQNVTEVLHFDDEERRALAETNARLFALEDNFESLYDVNLETGEYEDFIKGHTFSEKVSTSFVKHGEFFGDSYSNIDVVVFPDDREEFKRVVSPAYIRKELETKSHFDYFYRLQIDGEPVWFRMRAVYKDAGKKNVILGIFNASRDIEAKQIAEQKEQLEQQQNRLKESLSFTNFFLDTYISAYYVNLNTLRYQVFKRPEEQNVRYPFTDNFYDSLKAYINLDVHPDEREKLIELLSPESLRSILQTAPEYSYFYKSLSEGIEKTIRLLIIRGADSDHAAFGFADVTGEYEEQQKRMLGAMKLSNDVLEKANIGLWAFELDEGQPPRMYDDETMLGLVGLDHQVPPEEAYHAWYDNIDEGSYDLVTDAVNKMISGEHAEVQYPWHYPDGRTIMVRCGGVRNYEYTKGIRIEGTHQNVTETLHFDEQELKRAKQVENDLIISKLRADALAYISDNEPDLDRALNFFGNRILEITGCDQVIYREVGGRKIVMNAPDIKDIPESICSRCPFAHFDCEAFSGDGTVLMNDCSLGFQGTMAPADCPAKSSFMQMIHSGGELVGRLTVHYLNSHHTFTENGIEIMKTVAIYLGLMIGRVKEKQAEIARIEAESSNRAKTEFLFNMSHDIRTPMNAILGYTDIALNHIGEQERVNDSLRKIKTSGGHLLRLINDILEMSRIEAGRLEIVSTPLSVYEVSESVINMSQALAATRDITFNAEICSLKNPYVRSDELHINQVIINLISNAIKYTNPGGTVDYRIEQISESENGIANYRFTVRDNGIGMSEEFQKHLFESFAREQSATVSKQEGAGLGLAIVKKIVDLIGGTIRAESRQGEGSTFTVELPLEVMDEAEVEAFEASRSTTAEVSEDISLKGRRVLLVEDNEMNREIATEILDETGLTVDCAEDGALAVRKVAQLGADYYDFILMDIQMPVMNGYEATAEIRRLPGGGSVPIIALSANAFKEDVDKSLAAGMNDHVAKPIDVKDLFRALSKFM